ncbi:MAG TPA: malonate transporter subunit MadL [Candidatus Sulfotelmatobacter sp.]|jgi:malonate transporter MadL subunit|nr:malonate transporter subunit MadL [Candidatus Sulfotelmatobacter sp.]
MVIFGTALLAACYVVGLFIGDILGSLIGVKANVGGVGIAMIMLIAAQYFLRKKGWMKPESERGITFWAMMYIPVVVAMAATQNVLVAFKSGPMAVTAALGSVLLCAVAVSVINRIIERAHGGKPWQPEADGENL